MKTISSILVALVLSFCPSFALAEAQTKTRTTKPHKTTNWSIEPSFMFDTICLLNVLTGDPYYVEHYKDEYARFEPQLTPAARTALAEVKRKIKDESI